MLARLFTERSVNSLAMTNGLARALLALIWYSGALSGKLKFGLYNVINDA